MITFVVEGTSASLSEELSWPLPGLNTSSGSSSDSDRASSSRYDALAKVRGRFPSTRTSQ